ncbi:MAG TPA: hypothetical protein DCZ95_07670 [Verrucomicrobia bacterium]|nr:hypothetical protein [Verrucomicrobiota bacterium]
MTGRAMGAFAGVDRFLGAGGLGGGGGGKVVPVSDSNNSRICSLTDSVSGLSSEERTGGCAIGFFFLLSPKIWARPHKSAMTSQMIPSMPISAMTKG